MHGKLQTSASNAHTQVTPALHACTIAGNWIGGAIMVAGMHACVYGENVPRVKNAAWDATIGRLVRNKAK